MSDSTKKFHQYFSSRPTISITMENGNRIRFVGGVYMTDNESEIKFLDEQIRAGHQMIYIKQGHTVVDADALDPLAAIKKKAVEEYLENQRKVMDPNRDMGNTTADIKTSIQTSKSIAALTASITK